jgi:tetratricopeptide (TPR) repeat protein
MIPPSPAHPTKAPIWAALFICVGIVVAYHNSFHSPFVFDDASSIVTNPTIQRLWPLTEVLAGPITNVTAQGRPLLNLSLAINYAIGGTAVEGYHIGNLIIHTLAALTLFGIVRRTMRMFYGVGNAISPTSGSLPDGQRDHSGASGADKRSTGVALTIALLWAVHPLQTESVTYIIQRAESLVGLFYLLTFYAFVRGVEDARRTGARPQLGSASHEGSDKARRETERKPNRSMTWLTFSVLACTAGMATKEVMATAPLMLFFFDRTFFAGSFLGAWRQRRWFYIALAGTWILLGWLIAQTGGNRGGSVGFGVGVAWWEYWLTQFKAVAHYIWLSFWPHPLVFEYGSFWVRDVGEIVMAAALVLGLLTATIVALHRRSAAGFLGAWFFGLLAPTSLAPGTTQMIVEHRMYLPLAAVMALIVCGVQRQRPWRSATLVWTAGFVAVALVMLTARRNRDYRSDIILWTDTVAKRPDNPLAHFMLAGAQERAGNTAAAISEYERTLALKPDFSIGHENFGELLLRQGRRADAIAHFEAALRLQPDYADAHANLGNALLAEGRAADAVVHLETAANLSPNSAVVRYNFANALAAAGRTNDGVEQYQSALTLEPGMAEAHFNLANAFMTLARTADAMTHYKAAVNARPDYAAAHYNLANALASTSRQQDALEHYRAALRAQPHYPEAHHNLGSALFELGRLEEAAQHYEETLRLAPEFPNARANLERVRAMMQRR